LKDDQTERISEGLNERMNATDNETMIYKYTRYERNTAYLGAYQGCLAERLLPFQE